MCHLVVVGFFLHVADGSLVSCFAHPHQANEEEDGGQEEGRGEMVTRGKRLDIAELLGNAFIFLLAGT